MRRHLRLTAAFTLAALGLNAPAPADVSFEFVTVGDTTFAADPLTGFGLVPYEFRIATTEVTVGQYLEFLNTAAVDDVNGLYDTRMFNSPPGINIRGEPGSRSYVLRPGADPSQPMTLIDFLQAMRFVNWLHNGQGAQGTPEGDTERGAYSVADGDSEIREPGARFFIPSDDEWYKAAYHQPFEEGGNPAGYWLYPTSGDSPPTPGIEANYDGAVGSIVPVNSYEPNFRGLLNVAGNVWEFTEGGVGNPNDTFGRGARGGFYGVPASFLRADNRGINISPPTVFGVGVGLRVAAAPEGPQMCNEADLAEPFGLLDLADINAFVLGFSNGLPIADLAEPIGLLDLADINAFVTGFVAGCP